MGVNLFLRIDRLSFLRIRLAMPRWIHIISRPFPVRVRLEYYNTVFNGLRNIPGVKLALSVDDARSESWPGNRLFPVSAGSHSC